MLLQTAGQSRSRESSRKSKSMRRFLDGEKAQMVAAGRALLGHNGLVDILQQYGSSGHTGTKPRQSTSRHLGSLSYLVNNVIPKRLLLGSRE